MSAAMALLAALALVAGSALIIALAVFLAAAIAVKINPGPDVPVADQIERAEQFQREREAHESLVERQERRRGKQRPDSSHLTLPTFGITFALFMFAGAWSAILDHADAGGGPVPLTLLMRPLWLPWIPALIAALIAAASYRRSWERWPQWKRDLEIERRRERRRSGKVFPPS